MKFDDWENDDDEDDDDEDDDDKDWWVSNESQW